MGQVLACGWARYSRASCLWPADGMHQLHLEGDDSGSDFSRFHFPTSAQCDPIVVLILAIGGSTFGVNRFTPPDEVSSGRQTT